MTYRRLCGRLSILIAYERFIDRNMDPTTFWFGFPAVSPDSLVRPESWPSARPPAFFLFISFLELILLSALQLTVGKKWTE